MGAPAPQVNPVLQNLQARAAVAGASIKMKTQIFNAAVDPVGKPIVNIPVRNVGLILGFLVEVSGVVANTAATPLAITPFGSSNIVKNFTFTDLNNTQRINTSGFHLALLNSARQGFGFGGAYSPNLPMGYGNNYTPFQGPATVAVSTNANVRHTYYVPLAYSQDDLRGAIYAAVVNATMNLQLTLNSAPAVGAIGVGAGDPLNAIYSGNAAAAWQGNVQVTVTQVYLDQIPQVQGSPILPMLDLNTIYDLKFTTVNGLAVGADFPIPYANFRQFLSTMPIFDNGGAYNPGTDLNFLALQAANSTMIWKVGPQLAALEARQTFMADPPAGVYYFDHRKAPINTITFGNQQLILNPSTVNAGAQVVVGYESFQQTSQLAGSSSLAV